jgi:hypothetical protein
MRAQSKMNPVKSQDQALQRNGVTRSLESALLRKLQLNQNGLVSSFLFQRTQPISVKKLRAILQFALDVTSSEDLDLDFELDEEFEALERSLRG